MNDIRRDIAAAMQHLFDFLAARYQNVAWNTADPDALKVEMTEAAKGHLTKWSQDNGKAWFLGAALDFVVNSEVETFFAQLSAARKH